MYGTIDTKFLRRVAAVAATAACLVFAGCSELMSRDDFTARVKDKSDNEVAKAVGKPVSVETPAADEVTWTYDKRTFDIAHNNKLDTKVVVVFSKAAADGKLRAKDVKFE